MGFISLFAAMRVVDRVMNRGLKSGQLVALGSIDFFIYIGMCLFLLLVSSVINGVSSGLGAFNQFDLELLQHNGSPMEKLQAAAVSVVVKSPHRLLVTLLISNTAVMEAFSLCLGKLVNDYVSMGISIVIVVIFGNIIPQALFSRHALSLTSKFVWLVRFLLFVTSPAAVPIGLLLDRLFGGIKIGLYGRDQLKSFVSLHNFHMGIGGELSQQETIIMKSALDLKDKTARSLTIELSNVHSIDVNTVLDWEAIQDIFLAGFSRVLVYSGSRDFIVGYDSNNELQKFISSHNGKRVIT